MKEELRKLKMFKKLKKMDVNHPSS